MTLFIALLGFGHHPQRPEQWVSTISWLVSTLPAMTPALLTG
ncbi:MAG: hypothetical protein R2761_23265 [Acidimicrobiales bacterium]